MHTAGLSAEKWRVLAKAHERRNLVEYEGHPERDDRLLAELIAIAGDLRTIVGTSPPQPPPGTNT
jgi:hypothetical protein